jgi:hypothetical protein
MGGSLRCNWMGTFHDIGHIADLVLKNRLPLMFERSEFVEYGGLVFYASIDAESFKRAAVLVDKILTQRFFHYLVALLAVPSTRFGHLSRRLSAYLWPFYSHSSRVPNLVGRDITLLLLLRFVLGAGPRSNDCSRTFDYVVVSARFDKRASETIPGNKHL